MSEANQFRQYAQEAMRWARQAKTEKEKRASRGQDFAQAPHGRGNAEGR